MLFVWMSRIFVLFWVGLAVIALGAGVLYWKNFRGIERVASPSAKSNLIRIKTPQQNDIVRSSLVIEGEARGTWFFEADFPIYLYDGDGAELGIAIARAESNWMTADFVSFRAVMQFMPPKDKSGILVLKKNNPSGLPEHDDELKIPVRFP